MKIFADTAAGYMAITSSGGNGWPGQNGANGHPGDDSLGKVQNLIFIHKRLFNRIRF